MGCTRRYRFVSIALLGCALLWIPGFRFLFSARHFCFSLLALGARASTRPLGDQVPYLCSCKEELKKHAPEHCALRASCAPGPRQRPGSVDCTSMYKQRNARDPSRAPYGLFRPLPPQCNGNPEKPKQRASCAQKRRGAVHAPGSAFDRALDLRVPVSRGEGRTEMSAGSLARCARVRCTYTEVRSTNPGMPSRTAVGGAAPGVCSLDSGHPALRRVAVGSAVRAAPAAQWLLSLAQARESDPRAGRARKNERRRGEESKARARNWTTNPSAVKSPVKSMREWRASAELVPDWIRGELGMQRVNDGRIRRAVSRLKPESPAPAPGHNLS
jgi:hypothetical protein